MIFISFILLYLFHFIKYIHELFFLFIYIFIYLLIFFVFFFFFSYYKHCEWRADKQEWVWSKPVYLR